MIKVRLLSKGQPFNPVNHDTLSKNITSLIQFVEEQVKDYSDTGSVNVNLQGSMPYLEFNNVPEDVIRKILVGR